ncbi:MAG: response regulator [Elusimicrobia bacterium]|nr:response regulator [Elusimicrobiota bacterium]MDE2236610.1 response regulator [Elusimicrobiota bacterium]MDE2424590.1 response regulator [Elusimicrobiota bacterium]
MTNRSLFIVEDDPAFRETFVDAMSLRGVEVRCAGSGYEGLRALQTLRPSAIILDVRLPDLHGFELCRRLKRMEGLRKTPIVLISASPAYNDPRDRTEGYLCGAAAFLAKPVSVDALWSEVGALLA